MSVKLSMRDEVFLAEMGITPLWRSRQAPAQPEEAVEAAQPEETPAPVQVQAPRPPERVPAPGFIPPPPRDPAWGEVPMTSAPPPPAWTPPPPPVAEEEQGDSAEAIAAMDWDELRAAIARCTRCGDCSKSKPVHGAGALQARWFAVAGATSAADEGANAPLAGEAGKLFDNMLCAVGLTREQDVYVTNLVKCRPTSANGGDRAPTNEEAAACRPFVERELALTGAGVVLTLGQIAANGLLGKPLQAPLAGARGTVHALGNAALVATLHPGELLRRGADKALAWADLCRARAVNKQTDTQAANRRADNAGRGR